MQTVIAVYHDGAYKMTGKCFWLTGPERKLIFLHEESGSQGHRNLTAPGGIDRIVLPFLQEIDVEEIHHYNRKERTLFTSGLYNFLLNGVRQKSGGRDRVYLPEHFWHRDYHANGLPYKPPWINQTRQFGGRVEGTQLHLPGMGRPG